MTEAVRKALRDGLVLFSRTEVIFRGFMVSLYVKGEEYVSPIIQPKLQQPLVWGTVSDCRGRASCRP